ncbi:MAG: flagellar basal body L-ring protein FlgH [Pseudomonadota bacterium]
MKKSILLLSSFALAACAGNPIIPKKRDRKQPASEVENLREASAASLWNQDPESLFGNRRAREVGDILTVLVDINEEAQILNDTLRNRTSEKQIAAPAALGATDSLVRNVLPEGASFDPAFDVSSIDRMRGQGNFRRQDRITLRLAARVTDRLPNGDLIIEGYQGVQIGRDRRNLSVEGIVRPEDISRQNTVPHDRIAQADIRLESAGPLHGTSRPGLGNRLLNLIAPF